MKEENHWGKDVKWYLLPLAPLLSLALLCAVLVLYGKARVRGLKNKAGRARDVMAGGCLGAMGREVARHSSFRYLTRGSLSRSYFRRAFDTLQEGYLYLVLAKSKSPAGEIIGLFTDREYNHVSLSFDRDLRTLVSYNGGRAGQAPGLNPETVPALLENPGASLRVYRLPATRHQKQIILRRLGKLNQEGSAYNLLGLVFRFSYRPNIMFCSQFVYSALRLAGLDYFQWNPFEVRPTDFVELDCRHHLELVAELTYDGKAVHRWEPQKKSRPSA